MSAVSQTPIRSRIHRAPLLVILAVAGLMMFALALWGIWLTREGGRIASVWIANAAILSLMLVSARERWLGIQVAAFIGNLMANFAVGDTVGLALLLAGFNLIEIVLAAALIWRFQPEIDFTRLRDLAVFALVAGIAAPFVTAIVAASALAWVVGAPFLTVAVNWYASDALGLLVFVPLFMTALAPKVDTQQLDRLKSKRTISLLALNLVATVAVFAQGTYPLQFALMPPLILIAFRAGTTGAVIANVMTTVVSVGFTVEGYGPVTLVETTMHMRMALLQLYIATCVFVTLVVAAYLAEQKRLEDNLRLMMSLSEKANAAKSSFLSTVSHELRTPLTSIRGSLGLVSAGVAGVLPPKAENLVRIAHTNSERLVRLINDILDMEKIESGKMMFEMQRHPLRPIVEQAIETANNYMPDRRIRIVLVDDAPGSVVDVDADRMHQVVTNLLSNAIKFSPPAGIVQMRLAYLDHHVEIAVSDQGAGIPLAFRDRIFGKFEQADSSSTREKGGTGLGLSITKALVQHMSGAIGFETTDGAGTTFKVTLPLAADNAPVRSASLETREPRRILICEDDAETASIIAKLLARDGYGTDLAPDFSSAQSLLRDRTYAAIALDIDLAGDSGVRLFNEVRNSHHNGNIPVIVLSAAPDEARKSLNGAAVGIIDWLAKPVDPERLHASVQKIVAAPSHHRPRILHVEDDRDVLEVMAAGLGSDVAMTFAHNLAEARAQLAAQSFELVILDIGLPDGSGLDLLGELDDATPVIIFSASDLDGVLARKVKSVMTKTKRSEIDVARSVRAILAGRS